MCSGSACGILYKPETTSKDLTCRCGYRYWDIFQERFVPNHARRFNKAGRALPQEEQERDVKAQKSAPEFEASMRAQFIAHCIGCGIRRRLDDGEKDAGFDEPTFLRAMAELLEVAKGDFKSRGLSGAMQTVQSSLAARSFGESEYRSPVDAAIVDHQASRQRLEPLPNLRQPAVAVGIAAQGIVASDHSLDDMPPSRHRKSVARSGTLTTEPSQTVDEENLPRRHSELDAATPRVHELYRSDPRHSAEPAQRVRDDSRHKAQSSKEPRHSERSRYDDVLVLPSAGNDRKWHSETRVGSADDGQNEDDQSATDHKSFRSSSGRDDEQRTRQPMFLPEDGISEKILMHHQERETFGKWTSISRLRKNGVAGFSVGLGEGTRPLDDKQIKRILKESSAYIEAAKKQLRNR